MSDNNKNILKQALDKLPQYEPSNTVWEAIETRLPLLELPNYEPPLSIWENIENELVIDKKSSKKLSILRGYWWATAASVLIIFSMVFYTIFNKKNEQTETHISTELADNELFKSDDDTITNDIALVEKMCQSALPKCENEEFKSLKTELDELNKACFTLKNAMSEYNTDPDLMLQLSRLDNERSAILRKMMAFL